MPKDQSIITRDTLLVFGACPSSQQLTVRVENSSGRSENALRCADSGTFEFQIKTQEGANRVVVNGVSREVFRAVPGVAPPPGFLSLFIHSGETLPCATCHSERGLTLTGYPEICLQCHVIETVDPPQRTPLAEQSHFLISGSQCGKCHDPHGERDVSMLRAPTAELCGQCHGDYGSPPGLHRAFADGSCMACHDAHSSGFTKLLIQPVPGVCNRCHADGAGRLGDHHGALVDCIGCHDPHGKAGSGLVRETLDDRCRACHGAVGIHPALDAGCSACHLPHREDDRTRATVSCGGCHESAGEGGVRARHGGMEIPVALCARCHPPHAIAGAGLGRGEFHDPVIQRDCTACHQPSAAGTPQRGDSSVP